MSQPMNVSDSAAAEKNVAEGSAAIVDKEAVSITSLIFFIYFIYLFVFLSFFSRILVPIPLKMQERRQKALQQHPLRATM